MLFISCRDWGEAKRYIVQPLVCQGQLKRAGVFKTDGCRAQRTDLRKGEIDGDKKVKLEKSILNALQKRLRVVHFFNSS